MRHLLILALVVMGSILLTCCNQEKKSTKKMVSQELMEEIYQEVKTPFKYGVVFQHPDTSKLIDSPSEDFDQKYAHKPWVIKWKGVVYHFYNAVGTQGRVIALATSEDLKISVP